MCSPVRVPTRVWTKYAELAGLFFFQAMAYGMWYVPMGSVLDHHGMGTIKPYAFAASAAAAFISPLIFGAMADRHASPARVLRWLAMAVAASMVLVMFAIQHAWNPWFVLALIQVQSLFSAPTTGIAAAIVFAGLRDAQNEYGPVRAMATLGWMSGCWTVSALNADVSVRAGYSDAVLWVLLAAYTFVLPDVAPPKSLERLTLRQRMGWDALTLLQNRDHRVIFLVPALFNIPLAAFYPFTPAQMSELGLRHTSAWMTLGQVTELIAMFSLAGLLARWRVKWIIVLGLCVGLARFSLCAANSLAPVLAGVTLHGASFTCVFITAQMYVDQRVDPSWRVRAQSLILLLTSGVGNLVGFLGTGWWFAACTDAGHTHWPIFWMGLVGMVGAVLVYFLTAYHGIGTGFKRAAEF